MYCTDEKHRRFNSSPRKHIVLITNHGCHSQIIHVTTDTGGQNFYVNELASSLISLDYKVTILNRGGYRHLVTGKKQKGVVYYDGVWGRRGRFCRIMYLEDGNPRFIAKEKLHKSNLKRELEFFFKTAKKICWDLEDIYLINSHYWDAGVLGNLFKKALEKRFGIIAPHVWTTHSLGRLKQLNYSDDPIQLIKRFNFPYRIINEEEVINDADAVVSTSTKIRKMLSKYHSRSSADLWFPPGIDIDLYKPRNFSSCGKAIKLLSEELDMKPREVKHLIKSKKVLFEISRTALTKNKDRVLRAFLSAKHNSDALLLMTIDKGTKVYEEVLKLYSDAGNPSNIVLIDRFIEKECAAQLFSIADIFITASVMEGWGMSIQEAAASRCAIISSSKVPFATEVLGKNCLIVKIQNDKVYSSKIDLLIQDNALANLLSQGAYEVTSEHYSWKALARDFIQQMKSHNILRKDALIATDLDRTLLPNGTLPYDGSMELFRRVLEEEHIEVIYVTGRNIRQLRQALHKYRAPAPHHIISEVGTKIYHLENRKYVEDTEWVKNVLANTRGWNLKKFRKRLLSITGLRLQEKFNQNRFKQSYYIDDLSRARYICHDAERIVRSICPDAKIIYSVDETKNIGLLDVLPISANKLTALEYLRRSLRYKKKDIVYFGDSGNDLMPLTHGYNAVLVRNAIPEIKTEIMKIAKRKGIIDRIYIARGYKDLNGYYVSGMIEGLIRMGIIDKSYAFKKPVL